MPTIHGSLNPESKLLLVTKQWDKYVPNRRNQLLLNGSKQWWKQQNNKIEMAIGCEDSPFEIIVKYHW
jgi:hypothetical protein